jgi:serine/threonine protein kinase
MLIEIFKILGTPSKTQLGKMNPDFTAFKFPQVRPTPWTYVFHNKTLPTDAVDLVSKMLVYSPNIRIRPLEALLHPFFDELRSPGLQLPNGQPLPNLFDFTDEEKSMTTQEVWTQLIPAWYLDPEANEKNFMPARKMSGERKRRPSVEIYPGENPSDEIFKHMRKYMDNTKKDEKTNEKTGLPTA